MLISGNFASKTRWSIFTLGSQMHQATPGWSVIKDIIIQNGIEVGLRAKTMPEVQSCNGHVILRFVDVYYEEL